MRRARKIAPPHPADDCTDPQGFGTLLVRFLEALEVAKHSAATLRARRYQIRNFIAWASERDLNRPSEITRAHVELYQRHLFHHRKRDGRPLAASSQLAALIGVRGFFHWLTRRNLILFNPAAALELPRPGRRLPRSVLSITEAEAVFAAVDLDHPLGVRDRAILEVLYSTGIRRTELTRVTLTDIDPVRGTLAVHHGKGGKERIVPIGERALLWVRKYLGELRPELAAAGPPSSILFLNMKGRPLAPNALATRVERMLKRAGFIDRGCCHLFRHTCATLMLEGGADIRFIQALLGHAELDTTEVYTRVSIAKLKAIHTATHPAAELREESGDGSPESGESVQPGDGDAGER
jgi:integrase/recombinase XerD